MKKSIFKFDTETTIVIISLLLLSILYLLSFINRTDNEKRQEYERKLKQELLLQNEQGCNKGHVESCLALANAYNNGIGVEPNRNQAAILFIKAYNLSNNINRNKCDYELNLFYNKEYLETAKLFEQTCNNGDVTSCHSLGVMYKNGQGVEQNHDQAAKLFEQACNSGIAESCADLGSLKQNTTEAAKLYEQACNDNAANGCVYLGLLYQYGKGKRQNYTQAAQLYEKACNLDYADGCSNLAKSYLYGQGKPKDFFTAKEYYGKNCDLGNQDDCYMYKKLHQHFEKAFHEALLCNGENYINLSQIERARVIQNPNLRDCYDAQHSLDAAMGAFDKRNYRDKIEFYAREYQDKIYSSIQKSLTTGENAEDLFVQAIIDDNKHNSYTHINKLYEQTCNDGIIESCFNLGVSYHNGQGVRQNDYQAIKLWEKACNNGYALGCFNLGSSYYYGQGTPKDFSIAKEYYGKACDLGDQEGCDWYKTF
ncbi:MAG: SEL1-like repeat protein [Bacteroidales bacterium]|nr:SEL1-like repeat protein [Bacteroidales bacterium]